MAQKIKHQLAGNVFFFVNEVHRQRAAAPHEHSVPEQVHLEIKQTERGQKLRALVHAVNGDAFILRSPDKPARQVFFVGVTDNTQPRIGVGEDFGKSAEIFFRYGFDFSHSLQLV